VAGGEARRLGVVAQVLQPDRHGVVDEQAEDAASHGRVTDGRRRLRVDPDMDELAEATGVVEHSERTIGGIDQLDGRLHDPAQGRAELQAGSDGDDSGEQSAVALLPHALTLSCLHDARPTCQEA
jgi:hypothetical protein